MRAKKVLNWSDMFPDGRFIFYEGDDPEGFREDIMKNFGFDPAQSDHWEDAHCFHCPPEHLDVIYSDRYPMGS